MPKISDEELYRLHVMVPLDDILWLKANLPREESIASVFRGILKRLRNLRTKSPEISVTDLLEQNDWQMVKDSKNA